MRCTHLLLYSVRVTCNHNAESFEGDAEDALQTSHREWPPLSPSVGPCTSCTGCCCSVSCSLRAVLTVLKRVRAAGERGGCEDGQHMGERRL
jgi:hypothetical protein